MGNTFEQNTSQKRKPLANKHEEVLNPVGHREMQIQASVKYHNSCTRNGGNVPTFVNSKCGCCMDLCGRRARGKNAPSSTICNSQYLQIHEEDVHQGVYIPLQQ